MKITEYKPTGHTTASAAASLASSIKTAQAAGRVPDKLGKNLDTAVENTWREMQAMTDHAQDEGRDFLASESRTYTDMEAALDLLAPLNKELSRIDMPAGLQAAQNAAWGRTDAAEQAYAAGRPLAHGQTFFGYVKDRGIREGLEDLSDGIDADKYLRGVLFNQWKGADRELRIANAMSGASSAAGGVLIPTLLTAQIIDLARAQTRVFEAGAQLVPMESRTVDVPRWTTDPTLSWRTENAIVAESDAALDKITLSAKGLSTVVRASRELVEDTDITGALSGAIAAAFAAKIDSASMYADGASGAPTGVKANSGVTKTSMGANGASMTSWDNLVDSVGRLRDHNETPNASIMADRSARVLAKLKDTTNQPLVAPSYLDGVPRLTTSNVPINLTVGTSNDTSDVFTGDWSKLIVGVRTSLTIQILSERYMTNDAAGSPAGGQYGFLVWWRGDIALERPNAFDVITGVRG